MSIAVMWRGKIVKLGEPEVVLNNPGEQYTKKLLADVPAI